MRLFLLSTILFGTVSAFAGGAGTPPIDLDCRSIGYVRCASADNSIKANFEDVLCNGMNFRSNYYRLDILSPAGTDSFKNNSWKHVGLATLANNFTEYGVFGRSGWSISIKQLTPMMSGQFTAELSNNGGSKDLPASTEVQCNIVNFKGLPGQG